MTDNPAVGMAYSLEEELVSPVPGVRPRGAWKRQGPDQAWQRASVSGVRNANEGGQATLVVEPPVAACAMDFSGGQAGPTPVSVRG